MSEPIEAFFERLTGGGAGALPRRASGSLRIDLGSAGDHRTLVHHDRKGRRLGLPSQREGRRGDQDLQGPVRGHGHREGERDGRRAAWRRVARGRSHPPGVVPACPPGAAGTSEARGRPRGDGDRERRDRQDPRREHLRRERSARRHRGVAHRSDGPVLLRYPLPVDVGAHRERRAPQRALRRRPAVLRGPVLPGARDRHRVRRREAVRDPPARGRGRVPRGAHDPEPRTRSRSSSPYGSMRTRTSRTCSRSRTR